MDFVRPEGTVSNRRLTLITFYLHDSSGDGSLTAIKYEAMVHYCAWQSNQTFETNLTSQFWLSIDTYVNINRHLAKENFTLYLQPSMWIEHFYVRIIEYYNGDVLSHFIEKLLIKSFTLNTNAWPEMS